MIRMRPSKSPGTTIFGPLFTDDYDLRFYDCDSAYEEPHAQTSQLDYFQIGHYAGYGLVNRTEVEPMPVDPDFKSSGRYWLFALYPVLSPAAERGDGFVRYRYADPNKADDSWSYGGASRRVRRINESILSTATSAETFDPDHYSGFNPKTEQYDYKFLGEKEMLASAHAEHSPALKCEADG